MRSKKDIKEENLAALEKGFVNLEKHIENASLYGLPAVVAINQFATDTEAELALLQKVLCAAKGANACVANVWGKGGEGAENLARVVVETVERRVVNLNHFTAGHSQWKKNRDHCNKGLWCCQGWIFSPGTIATQKDI